MLQYFAAAWAQETQDPHQKLALLFIANAADQEGRYHLTEKRLIALANFVGCSPARAQTAVDDLASDAFLNNEERPLYVLNLESAG